MSGSRRRIMGVGGIEEGMVGENGVVVEVKIPLAYHE